MSGMGDNGGPPLDDDEGTPFGPHGYIKVARDQREHPLVGFGRYVPPAEPERGFCYSRAEAWQDLVMECRYQDGEVWNKGKKMILERGQLLGAISWLAHRWNWTPKTVRWFLDQIEADGMIVRPPTEKGLNGQSDAPPNQGKHNGKHNGNQIGVISISNYSIYQSVMQMQRQAKGQPLGQASGKPAASQGQDLNTGIREEGNTREVYYAAVASPIETLPAIPPEIATEPIQLLAKPPRAAKLKPDWVLPKAWGEWALASFVVSPQAVRTEAAKFKDHWISTGGKKIDWEATWRNWCRSDIGKKWKPRDGINGSIVDGDLLSVAAEPVDDGWAEVREMNRLEREREQ